MLQGCGGRGGSVQVVGGELVTMDRYGHLFPSDVHKAAMDLIAGELMG